MRYINRDWTRSQQDDFVLNIRPSLDEYTEACPIYINEQLVGWKIQSSFE